VLSGVHQGTALGLHLLFITVICNSIKHSKNFLFADTIKIAHSINSATDSKLSQSDIDSIHGQCAAGIIKLNTDETQFKSLRIVLIKQNFGIHMYFDLLFFYY